MARLGGNLVGRTWEKGEFAVRWQEGETGAPAEEDSRKFPYRYRVMLVDDEEEVREGVREKVEWNRCGFELVAEAANGQEAWETAKTVAPDVVITDIRMPFMSGLELCHNLRTMFPDICLVILTGYDDFDYAKRAIQENVTEYILKPVNFGEFTALMGRIREKLDQRLAQQYDLKRLREQYEMSLPAMREQLLARLLDSSVQEAWAWEKAREVRLSIAGETWAMALIRYNEGEASSRGRELLPHMVRQLAEKELPRYCPVTCFLYQDYVAVLATMDQQQDMLQLINGMRQICLSAQRFLQLELAVGIGGTCTALSQLRRSAEEARNALDYQTMVGEEPVVYIGDIEPQTTESSALEGYSFRELLAAMRLEDNGQIEDSVRHFLSVLRAKKMPVSQYRLSVMELATELMRVIKTYELEDTDDLSRQLVELTLLNNLHSPCVFEARLIQLCEQISHSIAQKRSNTSQLVAEEAKSYIQKHYSNPGLSLESVCTHLHLSVSHFSTLFKQETGCGFVNYLTQVRLTQAARMLDNTDSPVGEISQQVGYSEPAYFSYVFKKRYGVSPMKYRYMKERSEDGEG